jgi:hypothetical protein
MKVTESQLRVRTDGVKCPIDLIRTLGAAANLHAGTDKQIVRFVITGEAEGFSTCELGVFEEPRVSSNPDLFHFRKRGSCDERDFNAVFLVPTGIGAEIGGHSGDAGPVARLLSGACDRLVTHPNVGNAADINELPDNAMYVEGSTIADLLMGNIYLRPVRSNKLLLLMERHSDPWFMDATVNMASAARAAVGIDVREVVVLERNFSMQSIYAASGRAAGLVEGLECVCKALERRVGEFDAVAIASLVKVPSRYHEDYFNDFADAMVNPWGGVEAMLTHTLSRRYRIPTAHAPMMTSREVQTLDYGPVDPRKAAEPVSATYLFSVLKGLHRSPAFSTHTADPKSSGHIGVENIHCLVIPDGCVGIPTLAAFAQEIPVIAVKGNRNHMKNNLDHLPCRRGGVIKVENYLEAAGVMTALRNGITLESVRRPIHATKLTYDGVV